MAEWREKGYVPDSDDEEEGESFPAEPLPASPIQSHLNNLQTESLSIEPRQQPQGETHSNVPGGIDPVNTVESTLPIIPEASQDAPNDGSARIHEATPKGSSRLGTQQDSQEIKTPDVAEDGSQRKGTWAELLDSQLRFGLNTVADVLGSSQGLQPIASSRESTPLSSIASIASEPFSSTSPMVDTATGETASKDHKQGLESTPGVFTITGYQRDRSFRQRTAIQQNPYTLEAAQYQLSLKARGLKPIKVLQSHHDSYTHDSIYQTGQPSSPYNPPASPNDLTGRAVGYGSPSERLMPRSGDKSNHVVLKRRKLFHSNDRRIPADRVPDDSLFDVPSGNDHHRFENADDDEGIYTPDYDNDAIMQDSNISPINSQHDSSNVGYVSEDGFRFPRGMSPLNRNIPPRPSTPELSIPTAIELHDSSSMDGSVSSPQSDNSPPSDVEENETQGIGNFQRRIKGVLPASWLRLDRMKQSGPALKRTDPNALSPSRLTQGKGVAKRFRRSLDERRAYGRDFDEMLADKNDSSSTESPQQANASRPLHQMDHTHADLHLDVVIEDNSIDSMAPIIERTRHLHHGEKRKKQRRLEFEKDSPSNARRFNLATSGRGKSSRSNGSVSRASPPRRKARPPLPAFSIVDSDDVVGVAREKQPPFLRLAVRQAQSRASKGRRSPSNKSIRLANNGDTSEALATLSKWRTGQFNREHGGGTTRSRVRVPLQELDSNERTSTLDDLKKNTRVSRGHRTPNVATSRQVLPRKQHGLTAPNTARQILSASSDGDARGERKKKLNRSKSARGGARFGTLISRLQTSGNVRDAQVERLGTSTPHRLANSLAAFDHTAANDNTVWEKSPRKLPREKDFLSTTESTASRLKDHGASSTRAPRQPKKRLPVRSTIVRSSTDRPVPQSGQLIQSANLDQLALGERIQYPVTFDLLPLPKSACFETTTFVGSGKFAVCLGLFQSPHAEPSILPILEPSPTLMFGAEGSFQDSPQISTINLICTRFEPFLSNGIYGSTSSPTTPELNGDWSSHLDRLESIAKILSTKGPNSELVMAAKHTPFLSLQAAKDLQLPSLVQQQQAADHQPQQFQVLTVLMTISHLSYLLCLDHSSDVPLDIIRSAYESLLSYAGTKVFCEKSLHSIRSYLITFQASQNKVISLSRCPQIETIVSLRWLLDTSSLPTRWSGFWTFFNDCVTYSETSNQEVQGIRDLEAYWSDLFTVTMVIGFDPFGRLEIYEQGLRMPANWTRVKAILAEAGIVSGASRHIPRRPPHYTRAIFHRCFCLVQEFKWGEGELVIDCLYDFFRRRDLEGPAEDHYGCGDFLDNLTEQSVFCLDEKNSSFQSMIKLIAVVVKDLTRRSERDPDSKRRLKNMLFRLVPNNGHFSSKYEDLEEHQLTPLRNHHDLLTTLYCLSPPQFRPRLQRFEDLVNFTESHLSACRVSLGTWVRLVSFQISTREPVSTISSLTEMIERMIQAMVKQHRMVVQEVQAHQRGWSNAQVQSIIKYNKSQLERFLIEILQALIKLVNACPQDEQAVALVTKDAMSLIYTMFPARSGSCDELFVHLFDLMLALVNRDADCTSSFRVAEDKDTSISYSSNEDSQEYGDWSYLEAFVDSPPLIAMKYLHDELFQVMFRFIGEVMGSDEMPPSALIESLLSSWTTIIQVFEVHSLHSAANFVTSLHHESCSWFRGTTQKRLFQPFFLGQLASKLGASFYQENRSSLLESYVNILAEPRPFQTWLPRLSLAMVAQNEPLLQTSSALMLSSAAPSQILSTIMLNMRALRNTSENNALLKDIMHSLLRSMKANYQELDAGGDQSARNQYIAFVHRILDDMSIFLPEHRKLEPFFGDASSFPQPGSSVYVTLRQYSLGLSSSASQKSLVTFIHTILERAALEDTQDVLQKQLMNALDNTEDDMAEMRNHAADLQHFLLKHVFPAYLELMSTDACCQLMPPILSTIQELYRRSCPRFSEIHIGIVSTALDTDDSPTDPLSGYGDISSFIASTISLLTSYKTGLSRFDQKTASLLSISPQKVSVLVSSFSTISAILPSIDYLIRRQIPLPSPAQRQLNDILCIFASISESLSSICNQLMSQDDSIPPLLFDPSPSTNDLASPLLDFTRSNLLSTFQKTWSINSQEIHISNHNRHKPLLSFKSHRAKLEREIELYHAGVAEDWAREAVLEACRDWEERWDEVSGLGFGGSHRSWGRRAADGRRRGAEGISDWRPMVIGELFVL